MTGPRPVTALCVASGIALAAPAAYVAALSIAAIAAGPPPAPRGAPSLRLVVLVPAHDEELLVGRCVATLKAQDYPVDLFRVVVIADNCTDTTAAVARAAGADVLERMDPGLRGKGHALNWATGHLMAASDPAVDAFVVVDADSMADPGLLSALAAAAQAGALVVQADYGALVDGDDDRAQLRAAAFLLFHRVRFTGKAVLGRPCALVGNGMLFTRAVLQEHPWTAYSEVEDIEYTVQLRTAGIGPVFARAGRLVAPVASSGSAADVQRRRWEGGRMRMIRRHLPAVVRRMSVDGRLDLWDEAADLAVPPLGVLAVGIAAGTSAALALRLAGVVPSAALLPWGVACLALPVHVLVGLAAADAPSEMVAALRSAPRHVAGEVLTRARLLGRGGGGEQWVRTPRSDVDGA